MPEKTPKTFKQEVEVQTEIMPIDQKNNVVEVEKETWPAKLASEFTPSDLKTTEYFVRGTQPTEVSDRYTKLNDISNTKLEVTGNIATITWDYVLPTSLTDEYIEKHFSQAIFNKSREKLIADRKYYNANNLGKIHYGIYKENIDGTLELIEHTTEKSYSYVGSEPTTLVIKAEHSNFTKDISDGIKFVINFINDPTTELKVTLNGTESIESTVGNYKEPGIASITHGETDVTSLSTIKYRLTNGETATEYLDTTSLETAVNALPAGTYSISYIVNFSDANVTHKRTIILK